MRSILLSAMATAALAAACQEASTKTDSPPLATAQAIDAPDPKPAGPKRPAADNHDFRPSLSGYLDCLRWNAATVVSAHRGGPGAGLAENTLEAMDASVEGGAPLVEIDVRRTRDGTLVLMRDTTLERTTSLEGELAEVTLVQLQEATMKDGRGDAAPGFPPTLEQALQWSENRALVQIDVKDLDDLRAISRLVQDVGAKDRVLLIAYTEYGVSRIADDAPGLAISAPAESAASIAEYESEGVPADELVIFMGVQTHDPDLDRALDDLSVESIFGTLGGRQSWDARAERSGDDSIYGELAEQGVEVIATDRPLEAMAVLRRDREMAAAIDACEPVFKAAVAPR